MEVLIRQRTKLELPERVLNYHVKAMVSRLFRSVDLFENGIQKGCQTDFKWINPELEERDAKIKAGIDRLNQLVDEVKVEIDSNHRKAKEQREMWQSEKVRSVQEVTDYYKRSREQMVTKSNDIQDLLKLQIFSQQMMEILINDLLDLAKLENNKFKLDQAYFNLG